jgi:nucleotide-binding universal stress UspA family protein
LWSAPKDETALRARLRALRPAAERDGVTLRIVTLRGKPESAISAYAQLAGASLIVVGRNYATSRFWRSTAITTRVSRRSAVPSVVVPRRIAKTGNASLKHVVAAVDFTVASAMALRAAVDLSRRHRASLTILHAMEAPPPMLFSGGEAWRLVQRLPGKMRVLAERLKKKAIALGAGNALPVVVTGDPAHGIVETARETEADLIVMGVAPRTWLDEAVSGSTLRRVLRRAKTPVLVVPVIAGAHQWIDEVEEDVVEGLSSGDALRRAA